MLNQNLDPSEAFLGTHLTVAQEYLRNARAVSADRRSNTKWARRKKPTRRKKKRRQRRQRRKRHVKPICPEDGLSGKSISSSRSLSFRLEKLADTISINSSSLLRYCSVVHDDLFSDLDDDDVGDDSSFVTVDVGIEDDFREDEEEGEEDEVTDDADLDADASRRELVLPPWNLRSEFVCPTLVLCEYRLHELQRDLETETEELETSLQRLSVELGRSDDFLMRELRKSEANSREVGLISPRNAASLRRNRGRCRAKSTSTAPNLNSSFEYPQGEYVVDPAIGLLRRLDFASTRNDALSREVSGLKEEITCRNEREKRRETFRAKSYAELHHARKKIRVVSRIIDDRASCLRVTAAKVASLENKLKPLTREMDARSEMMSSDSEIAAMEKKILDLKRVFECQYGRIRQLAQEAIRMNERKEKTLEKGSKLRNDVASLQLKLEALRGEKSSIAACVRAAKLRDEILTSRHSESLDERKEMVETMTRKKNHFFRELVAKFRSQLGRHNHNRKEMLLKVFKLKMCLEKLIRSEETARLSLKLLLRRCAEDLDDTGEQQQQHSRRLIEDLRSQIADCHRETDANRQMVCRLDARSAKLALVRSAELSEIKLQLQSLSESSRVKSTELDAARNQLSRISADLTTSEQLRHDVKGRLSAFVVDMPGMSLLVDIQQLKSEADSTERQLEDLRLCLASKEEEVGRFRAARRKECDSEISELEESLGERKAEGRSLEESVRKLQCQRSQLHREREKLSNSEFDGCEPESWPDAVLAVEQHVEVMRSKVTALRGEVCRLDIRLHRTKLERQLLRFRESLVSGGRCDCNDSEEM